MDLRGTTSNLEKQFFWGIPIALLAGSAATLFLMPHFHPHNPRIQYGMKHLPEALLLAGLFAAIAGLLFTVISKSPSVETKPASYYLIALVIAFCLCWLPVLLTGGFVQDDWLLLSAASIRKIIYVHPGYAWFTLDTVDGNFRPLGTTLYFAYILKFFGAKAVAFLCGNFVVNLLGSIVAFFIVLELGYSMMAGAAASLLYMTRGLNYTENAWACAVGDGVVILLGGLAVLGILRANRGKERWAVAYYYGLAWALLWIATFAKQSSFAIPLILALLVLLRPGEAARPSLRRRAGHALLALIFYSIPVVIVFFHAKTLLRQGTPYPLSLTLESFTQWLCYVPWYFVGVQFPGRYTALTVLTKFIGAAILVGFAVFVARVPRTLGRPRDIGFLLLAALAAISPYILLPTRIAPYYGSMSAFWISMAFGIALTQFGGAADKNRSARNAYFALYLLVIVGSLDIRLKQTGLIPSGGYIWGTYGMDQQKNSYEQLAGILARYPAKHTLVLVDPSEDSKFYTSMALLADPDLEHILVYDPVTGTYQRNDLAGSRPKDDLEALNDPQAYHWSIPMDSSEADKAALQDPAIWIEFDSGRIHPVAPFSKK